MRASLPVLDNLRIASPCNADWDQMRGDDRTRFCGECKQNVYNLTGMTRDEARALLAARDDRMCVRYFQRHDGTILLGDCEIGVRRRRGRRLLIATAALGLATAGVTSWRLVSRESTSRPLAQPVSASQRAMTPAPVPVVAATPNARSAAELEAERAAKTQRAQEALQRAIEKKQGKFYGGGLPAHRAWSIEPKPSHPAQFVITE